MPKVLIVEDDEAMATALSDGFAYEQFTVTVARDGLRGLKLALESFPDLIVLDVMLPKMSGLDICKRVRAERNVVPIIMLTARGQEIDKVLGLKTGADDYITKPFSFMELMARVEAVMRRSRTPAKQIRTFRFGDVEVDFRSCEARKAGKPIQVSARELRLLAFLVERRGEVLSREQLLHGVWGYEEDSLSRTVDVHIAKLRRKIEDKPADPRHIVTVHGLGYKFTG
jgi:two-component system alkaline phosphatase synthesis response regulator PhoP